jgi:hypothetical protein
MIFVTDKGRMCNNILQYGHLYAWARENNCRTVSMRFAYKYQYFHICDTTHHNFMTYVCAKYAAKVGLIPTVDFDAQGIDFQTSEAKLLQHHWLLAEGWSARWYDLFLKYKSEILKLFAFHNDIEEHTRLFMAGDDNTLKLGVHIRRGDYATWHHGRYLYSDAQFISIIQQFLELHHGNKVKIYICGNDPQLNKHTYTGTFGLENVAFPDGNPGEDLCVLSHCDYLIGAPSTFTLVASMYHDTPLYWIKDANAPLGENSFGYFKDLFRHII